jgi:hypothetical protein
MAEKMISEQECSDQVKLMARRAALLHFYFSKTLVEELGEEEGMRLIKKAIWAYGGHVGRVIREKVEAMGLPNSEENFDKIPDLPKYGWDTDVVTLPNGETHPIARFCPLAATLMELGEEGYRLGRLYCYVDQAKQEAYNPDVDFIHAKNVLDCDPYCEFVLQPHKD